MLRACDAIASITVIVFVATILAITLRQLIITVHQPVYSQAMLGTEMCIRSHTANIIYIGLFQPCPSPHCIAVIECTQWSSLQTPRWDTWTRCVLGGRKNVGQCERNEQKIYVNGNFSKLKTCDPLAKFDKSSPGNVYLFYSGLNIVTQLAVYLISQQLCSKTIGYYRPTTLYSKL